MSRKSILQVFIILIASLTICASCSQNGNPGSSPWMPGNWQSMDDWKFRSEGKYCDVYDYAGIAGQALCDRARDLLDRRALELQNLLGTVPGKVKVMFNNEQSGEYDSNTGVIYISTKESHLECVLIHEYSHFIFLFYHPKAPPWLLETIAEGTEWYLGFEVDPGVLTESQYDSLETVVSYTVQRSFGIFLLETYGENVFHKIISSKKEGREAISEACEEVFEDTIKKWKEGGK